jgi:hypothetical protein
MILVIHNLYEKDILSGEIKDGEWWKINKLLQKTYLFFQGRTIWVWLLGCAIMAVSVKCMRDITSLTS